MKHTDRVSRAALAAMLAMLLLVSVQSRWLMAAMLCLLIVPSLFVLYWPHRVPRGYITLFLLAMATTAAAYTLNGFARISWLDKLVHFYSGFVITPVFGLMLYGGVLAAFAQRRLLLLSSLFCVGTTVAVLWEIAEWILDRYVAARIVRGLFDAMTDLLAGLAGALLAAALVAFCAALPRSVR